MRSTQTSPAAGFTLIELVVVVATIGIIAAISIPSLLRSRMSANEAAAAGALAKIAAAQHDYHDKDPDGNGKFDYAGDLTELATFTLDDPLLGAGRKDGYDFSIATAGPERWFAYAVPSQAGIGRTGERSFYVDETGVIRVVGCPPGYTPVAGPNGVVCKPATVSRSASVHDPLVLSLQAAAGADALGHGQALPLAKQEGFAAPFVSSALRLCDKDLNGRLTFHELINCDLLGAARAIARSRGDNGHAIGSDAHLREILLRYQAALGPALGLHPATETIVAEVEINCLEGQPKAVLDLVPAGAPGR